MKHTRVFVADLGTTKIAVLSATLNDSGNVKVDGVWVTPCKAIVRGEIRDEQIVLDALTEALERVEADVRAESDEIYFSVEGTGLQSMRTQGFTPIYPSGRSLKRQDVHQVINHSRQVLMPPGREQLMAVPTEFRVDHQRKVQQPIGMPAARLSVLTHIVTVDSARVNKLDILARQLDKELVGIVPSPLAAALGVATQDNVDQGCIVVDIGGSVTSVSAFTEGMLAHLCCIPVGGDHVTSDLSQLLKLDPKVANRLKIEKGYAKAERVDPEDVVIVPGTDVDEPRHMQRRVLCEIIEARLKEIIKLVRESLETGGIPINPKGGFLLTGGGSLVNGFDSLFAENMDGIKVKVVQPKASGGHSREIGTPSMAVAVGLARYALEEDYDEFEPASGHLRWSDAVRTLKSVFGGRS